MLQREPVLISAFVAAVLAVFVAFGGDVTTGQKAAIDTFIAAAAALAARSQVTPTSDPRL